VNDGCSVFVRGVPTDYCCLLLHGRLQIRAGGEGFLSEIGPWTMLGLNALTNEDYTPDFTATVVAQARIFIIPRRAYQRIPKDEWPGSAKFKDATEGTKAIAGDSEPGSSAADSSKPVDAPETRLNDRPVGPSPYWPASDQGHDSDGEPSSQLGRSRARDGENRPLLEALSDGGVVAPRRRKIAMRRRIGVAHSSGSANSGANESAGDVAPESVLRTTRESNGGDARAPSAASAPAAIQSSTSTAPHASPTR